MEVASVQAGAAAQEEAAVQEEMAKPKKKRKRTKREDVIVTARVPLEIRNQAVAVLESIGSTPTELINAAFEYVIVAEELPQVGHSFDEVAARRKELTVEQKREMRDRLAELTPKAPAFWEGQSFDELRAKALGERYGLQSQEEDDHENYA